MGLREKINGNPAVGAGIGIVLAIAAGWWCYAALTDRGGTADAPRFYFYTSDDGNSFFSMSADEVPPLMKDGKEAVRAHVYTCDGGKTTLAVCLEKFNDDFKKRVDAERSKPKDPNAKGPPALATLLTGPESAFARLVKRPGDRDWVPATSAQGVKVQQVRCPSDKPEDLSEKLP